MSWRATVASIPEREWVPPVGRPTFFCRILVLALLPVLGVLLGWWAGVSYATGCRRTDSVLLELGLTAAAQRSVDKLPPAVPH
jgi:hypothetical protein